jgi:hypothetical protein
VSLLFHGPNGSFEQPWVVYALMCDTVQHHLERRSATRAFRALHRVSRALVIGTVAVPARRLHVEARFLKRALADRPISDLAITAHTLGAFTFRVQPGRRRRTRVVGRTALQLPLLSERSAGLSDLFGVLLDELVRITADAKRGEMVDVHDV